MQIIIRRMTLTDLIYNIFYKIRYRIYNKYGFNKLKNISNLYKKGYCPTFVDDFDKESWSYDGNNKLWKIGEPWGLFHPENLSVYYSSPDIIKYNNNAIFFIKYNPKEFIHPKTKEKIIIPFESSKLSSHKTFIQSYGRFECRCTLPNEKSTWPAFWLWGKSWPPEIDIFETYGKKDGKSNNIQQINLHYGFTENKTKNQMKPWKIKVDDYFLIDNVFHEYALEWKSNKIEMFIDGVKIFRYTRKKILNKYFNTSNAKMGIVINHSIDPNYSDIIDKDYYSEFKVDYIRAYNIKKDD